MTHILVLETSLFPSPMSASRQVTEQLVAQLTSHDPAATLTRRDLAKDPVPHVGLDLMAGATTAPNERSPEQARAVAESQALIDELFAADIVIVGAPMYNFGIPSGLKAWIDNISIAGQTFRYTAEGRPEGLVTGKRVFLAASRGGRYSEGPMAPFNYNDTYLRAVLGFLGMTDVTVILAEGMRMGPDARAAGLAEAARQVADTTITQAA